ncbi:hypothetical protein [Jannaschia sp. W003]|uniref:hypothetical protein n=1 Tax=Jannaschia sp. W003 TaxID=2867012 RepID=UPI0021A3C6E8|nr:hypothetical protein [Jannaschia sp. W003]UWQ20893.1 hypothetical protein K3554_13080 [Jannaschia sp. W003]
MKRILLATTFAAMSTGAAFADAHMMNMSEGFNMLQTALMADFERMGIPTDTLDDLTLGQIAAIKQIVESEDESNQKNRIEAIIANN